MKTFSYTLKTRHRLQILLVIPALLALVIALFFSWWEHDKAIQSMIQQEGEVLMSQLLVAAKPALTSNDTGQMSDIISALSNAPEVLRIQVLNSENQSVFRYDNQRMHDDVFVEYSRLVLDASTEPVSILGAINLQMSKEYYLNRKNIVITALLPIISLYGLFLILISVWHRHNIALPIDTAIRGIHQMQQGEPVLIESKLNSEIGSLLNNINELSVSLQHSKAAELRQKRALKTQLSVLAKTQQDTLDALNLNERFLKILSEEIKGPVNLLNLMLTLTADTKSHSLQARYLKSAQKNADYLETLVDDVGEFAKLVSDEFDAQARECDVDALLKQCVDSLGDLAEEHGKQLQLHSLLSTDNLGSRAVYIDTNRLIQIIINMIQAALNSEQVKTIILIPNLILQDKPHALLSVEMHLQLVKEDISAETLLEESVAILVARKIATKLNGQLSHSSSAEQFKLCYRLQLPSEVRNKTAHLVVKNTQEEQPAGEIDMLLFCAEMREATLLKNLLAKAGLDLYACDELKKCTEIYVKTKSPVVILELKNYHEGVQGAADIRIATSEHDYPPCLLVALTDDAQLLRDEQTLELFDLVLPKPNGLMGFHQILLDLFNAKQGVDSYLESLST